MRKPIPLIGDLRDNLTSMAAMASYLYLSRSKQHDDWQCDTLRRGECQILMGSRAMTCPILVLSLLLLHSCSMRKELIALLRFRMVLPCLRSHSSRASFSQVVPRSISKRRRQAAESQIWRWRKCSRSMFWLYFWLYTFALSNFRVSFHVCSCLFMSARGAPKSLHIPLGPGRSATLAAACSWKGLHWTVQRIPSYSGHLEGASPTSSNHDEPLPGKSLQAFVCLIILMTFRF